MANIVKCAGQKRKILGEILPLETPLALHIYVSSICNLKCGYCLHSLDKKTKNELKCKSSLMGLHAFKSKVRDLKRFQSQLKVVIFAGWGEPLLHPDLPEMIACVKTAGIAERVEVVSNGVLLSDKRANDLINAGLDRMRISIQGISSEVCERVTNVQFDFDQLVNNISNFYSKKKQCSLYLKTVDKAVPSDEDKQKFYATFENISDEIAIEHIIPAIAEIDHSQFGSNFEVRHCGGPAEKMQICPFPFYMAVIHPDGCYAPCCAVKFPDISSGKQNASVFDVWQSEALRQFRVAHLEGKRGNSIICKSCMSPKYDTQQEDSLDKFFKKLLPKYLE